MRVNYPSLGFPRPLALFPEIRGGEWGHLPSDSVPLHTFQGHSESQKLEFKRKALKQRGKKVVGL